MENLKSPPIMGKKIYKLLEKNRILLLQDKAFPSIVCGIVGEKLKGSWWGHPLANPIYNGLLWLEHNRPTLSVKLIDGKVTYLHESLFDDFYSVVCEPRDWQMKKLKDEDRHVLEYVFGKKKVASDDPHLNKLSKDPKKSFVALEKLLLVYSVEEHTPSGKHVKEYMDWRNSKFSIDKPNDYLKSKSQISEIVTKLSDEFGAKVKLPW